MPWMWPVGWQVFMWASFVHAVAAAQATMIANAAAVMAPSHRPTAEVVEFPAVRTAREHNPRADLFPGGRVVELRPIPR